MIPELPDYGIFMHRFGNHWRFLNHCCTPRTVEPITLPQQLVAALSNTDKQDTNNKVDMKISLENQGPNCSLKAMEINGDLRIGTLSKNVF